GEVGSAATMAAAQRKAASFSFASDKASARSTGDSAAGPPGSSGGALGIEVGYTMSRREAAADYRGFTTPPRSQARGGSGQERGSWHPRWLPPAERPWDNPCASDRGRRWYRRCDPDPCTAPPPR